jgi:hypothetical protein
VRGFRRPKLPKAAQPDFIGVGAQRAGTTWWFRLLLQHPDIRRSTAKNGELSKIQTFKELHFFNEFCARPMEQEDIDRYHALFPPIPGAVRGEWTPRYMYDPLTPKLLHRAAPDTKILVLLRDPIERYKSGLAHQIGSTPKRPMESMVTDAVCRSRYAVQLRRLFDLYPAEQILVLQYERCRNDTKGELVRTLRFLGVSEDMEPQEVVRSGGRIKAVPKQPLWPEFEEELRITLETDVRELLELTPSIDPALWPNFTRLAGRPAVS